MADRNYIRAQQDRMLNLFLQSAKVMVLAVVAMSVYILASPTSAILDSYARRMFLEAAGMEVLPDLERRVQALDESIT